MALEVVFAEVIGAEAVVIFCEELVDVDIEVLAWGVEVAVEVVVTGGKAVNARRDPESQSSCSSSNKAGIPWHNWRTEAFPATQLKKHPRSKAHFRVVSSPP